MTTRELFNINKWTVADESAGFLYTYLGKILLFPLENKKYSDKCFFFFYEKRLHFINDKISLEFNLQKPDGRGGLIGINVFESEEGEIGKCVDDNIKAALTSNKVSGKAFSFILLTWLKLCIWFGKKTMSVKGSIKTILPATIVEANYKTDILTVKWSDGMVRQYCGSSTVWYSYPYMQRCVSGKERELCDLYKYIQKHGNPYPFAHIKPS